MSPVPVDWWPGIWTGHDRLTVSVCCWKHAHFDFLESLSILVLGHKFPPTADTPRFLTQVHCSFSFPLEISGFCWKDKSSWQNALSSFSCSYRCSLVLCPIRCKHKPAGHFQESWVFLKLLLPLSSFLAGDGTALYDQMWSYSLFGNGDLGRLL